MIIRPTASAKNGSIFELHKDAYDFLLYTKRDDTPAPMDADIYVEDGNVVIEGSIMGSDVNRPDNAGYCKCVCSIRKFNQWYEVEAQDDMIGEYPEILDAIKEAGWEIVE